jgi:hypothetical protein
MHIASAASLALITLMASFLATPAHSGGLVQNKPVIGYQDPQTGLFHPLSVISPQAATVATTGKVEVTFNIKIVSTFATGTLITCSPQVIAVQISTTPPLDGAASFSEYESVVATTSGATATCKLTIPYDWQLLPAASVQEESFTGQYTVTALQVVASASTPTGIVDRISSGTFVAAATIPASGTTSKYTVDVTL